MILAGQGITIAEAEDAFRTLVEKADIPVGATLLGLSTLPSDHRLFKGMLGMHGNFGPNVNTNRADLIVAIGMRFDDRVTGVTEHYAPQAKIVHIDIDTAAISRNVVVDVPIVADAKLALEKLIEWAEPKNTKNWLEEIRAWDRENPL